MFGVLSTGMAITFHTYASVALCMNMNMDVHDVGYITVEIKANLRQLGHSA